MREDDEERRLLEAVRRATVEAAELRERADAASARRREAVQAAMDAGVPRARIAEAAGTHRSVLYQILKH